MFGIHQGLSDPWRSGINNSVTHYNNPEDLNPWTNRVNLPYVCKVSGGGYSISNTACNNDWIHVLSHTHTHLLLGHTSHCVRLWARLFVILVLSTSMSQTPVGPDQDLLTPSEFWLATLLATYLITDSLPSLNHCTYLDTILSPWSWRHHTPVKHQCQHTILYSIKTQKTTT
jgi:hypothetical protein